MDGVAGSVPPAPGVVVMVFGTGKNGKSTMLNALLGENLLPSGSTTCTGNSTEIGGVTNAAGKEIVRLHRAGQAMQDEELMPSGADESRIRTEWVTDMRIDKIVVEHMHETFQRHNVTIMDVPGLNQDSVRSQDVDDALAKSDILLVVCSAQSATGGLTLEEKNVLTTWQTQWEKRWEVRPASQVIVVCNKMDAIDIGRAQIPRTECLQLIVDNSKRFKSKRLMKMSREERLEQAEEDYEDSTDAELDDEARPYKKPDEGPIRRKVQEDAIEVFGESIVQQEGVHFVSANAALGCVRRGGAPPGEFVAMQRCLMDRIEKAGPEKAQRLAAADARRRQEELEAARRVAAARAESEEAERLELERQAAALRDKQRVEQEERRRRMENLAAERAAFARMQADRNKTWAASSGLGVAATGAVGGAAVIVPTGGAAAIAGATATGAAGIGLTGGAAAAAVAAAPVVAAGSAAAAVGLGVGVLAKQASFMVQAEQDLHSVDLDLRVGGVSCSNSQLGALGITELRLEENWPGIVYAYVIRFRNTEYGNWAFRDANGGTYKISCLRKGTHNVAFNSTGGGPTIVRVFRF